ncbi:MAG: hypothetical protein AAF547_14155 [Actinomycetota bacterium]
MTSKAANDGKPAVDPFPLSPAAMFREGVEGFRREPVLLVAGGVMTFAVSMAIGIPAQNALEAGDRALGFALSLISTVLGATAAYPWFSYALDAARGEPASFAKPFRTPGRFLPQFVASFWFWAGVLFGIQFLFGVPALLVTVFYAFFGYLIVDRHDLGGMKALGTSVRLGDKRRIGLFAILGIFAMFNFFAFLPLGYAVNPGTVALTLVLVLVTTSVTLVAGAALYDVLRVELPDG